MGFLNPVDPENDWTAWDYARLMVHHLRRIAEGVNEGESGDVKRIRRGFVIQTDASGNGQSYVDLSPGVEMNLLTYSFQIAFTGAASGYIAFYRDSEEGTALITSTTTSNLVTENFNAEGHFVPESSRLLIVARGIQANLVVAGNVTAKASTLGVPRATTDSGEFS